MSIGGTTDRRDDGGTPSGAFRGQTAARGFAVLLAVAAFALSFFYADRNLPFQDEGATLTAASRILDGDVFYRDIDAYPFPGAAYLAAGAMGVWGEHLSVARAMAGVFFCVWLLALYFVALRLLGLARAVLLGAAFLSWKFLAWPAFSTYMYSDLAFTAGCGLLACLFASRRAPRLLHAFVAGLCAAVAVAGKQNLGLYLGAATLLVLLPMATPWRLPGVRSWRPLIVFGLSAATPLLLAGIWFASEGVLGRLLYSGLVRPFTGYLPTSGIAFAPMLAWWDLGSLHGPEAASYFILDYFQLLMVEGLPRPDLYGGYWLLGEIFSRGVYTAVVVAVVWWLIRLIRIAFRSGESSSGSTPPAEAAFGLLVLAILASAFPRADFFHIISVAPPVLLLLVLLASRTDRPMRWPWFASWAVLVLLVTSGTLAGFHRALLTQRVELERANVWVAPGNAWMGPLVEMIDSEVSPNQPFYVYGHEAQIYFLTGRFFAWPFSQLYPGQVGPDGGEEIADLLASNPPPVIVRGRQFWPGMPRTFEYAPRLEQWIRKNYVRDPNPFRRHPLPAGSSPPKPQWMTVLRYRGAE